MTVELDQVGGGTPANTIAFQGEAGANSHMACREAFPDMAPLACRTFEDALGAISEGRARLGMIPIENSVAGRVADIHHLLPGSGLHIVGEHFLRIHHQLLGLRATKLADITHVRSHVMALDQCRNIAAELGLQRVVTADTAGAAREVAEAGDKSEAAIASTLAAEIYGLKILRADIEDEDHNTTRFIIMARAADQLPRDEGAGLITSLIFKVRNVPAALYKALGGFATNGINMTKLESYQLDGRFQATQFYAEVDGDPADEGLKMALDELGYYSDEVRVLGTYAAHPYRLEQPGG